MIKSIYIDGLKSLKEFNLELKPGLNALVGPNGSGKTNILTAFELLSNHTDLENISQNELLETVNTVDLFSENTADKSIRIKVNGELETVLEQNEIYYQNYDGEINVDYTYEFEMKYTPENMTKMVFTNQVLDIEIQSKNDKPTENDNMKIEYNGHDLNIDLDKKLSFNRKFFSTMFSYYNNNLDIFQRRSLVHEFRTNFSPLVKIGKEFASGMVFNVDPKLIRRNIYKLGATEINGNGMGLLSVLLKMKENTADHENGTVDAELSNVDFQEFNDTLICYLQELLPEIIELNVRRSPDKIDEIIGTVKFKVEEDIEIDIPIGLMSDGTLKWLTLIAVLLNERNLFILEEPENGLHPAMQQQILELIRDSMDEESQIRIITSHSETILNKLDPSEIHLIFHRGDRTHVKYVEDKEHLRELMHDSGFKFGWFYLSGKFDYENMQ